MIIDLSHTINTTMPMYPETPSPKIYDLSLQEKYGVNVQFYEIEGHLGTHIDTPKHLVGNELDITSIPVDRFYGKAKLFDCTRCKVNIEISDVTGIENLAGCQFVIFKTGWYKKWGKEEYFKNFPVLSSEVIDMLVDQNVFGIGLDTCSIDTVENEDLSNHKHWLNSDKIIIENLTNLDAITQSEFYLSCFPLKFENGDGSPVRAVAYLE